MKIETLIVKKDGIVSRLEYTSELETKIKEDFALKINGDKEKGCAHCCWDCTHARPSECIKVRNRIKGNIGDYSEITDGYMIEVENTDKEEVLDKCTRFFVAKCTNFDPEKQSIPVSSKRKSIVDLKKKLANAYYGTEDYEEAELIQMYDKLMKYTNGGNVHPNWKTYYAKKAAYENKKHVKIR